MQNDSHHHRMDDDSETMESSQTISLKIQKKIASKLSTKNVAKIFIDDTTGHLLDNVQKLVKAYTNSKKQAEQTLNDIIKIIVKIGLLTRNNQFNDDEMNMCVELSQNMVLFVKSTISFYEVEHTVDVGHLIEIQDKSHELINGIIRRHLSEKTLARVSRVFELFANRAFWEEMFRNKPKYKHAILPIIADAKTLLDNNTF